MTQKEKILAIARKNNGVLLTQQVNDADIGSWALRELENDEKLLSVQRGIYVTDNGYVDDFFIATKV